MKRATAAPLIFPANTLLRANPADSPIWQEVDEGWIGYTELAGRTFLLDPFSRFVLDAILSRDGGIRRGELPGWLSELAPDLDVGRIADALDAALETLHAAQLIESLTPPIETR